MSESNRVVIPLVGWAFALASAVESSPPNSIIVLDSGAKLELAKRGAERMGRTDLQFEYCPKESK